jgi:phosphoadenosine phosphosulfate reductase
MTVPPAPEELKAISDRLETATPQEILRWAVDTYHPRLTMATAFGAEGCAIIHMLAEIEPSVGLFNLETGYQFPETLETRDRLMERYGVRIALVQSDQGVPAMVAEHGGPLYDRDPNLCCYIRKVVPLRRALAGHDAWISAIRRDQTPDRATAGIVQWDGKFGLVKVNPLAKWTRREVWSFIMKHGVPYNPLHDQGYPSIGCWPCTRSVASGEDDRAGRWSGLAKTECGLHTSSDLINVASLSAKG